MANRKGKFKVKNGSGSYDQVMLETQLGQVVDSPIKSLERNTYYEQNDVVAEQTCKGAFLVCTTAGTTAASVPSGYSSVAEGGSVTDGTAVFTAHRFNNLANIAAIIAHNALETAHPSLDFIKSLSAASDGIHYRTRNGKSDQVLDLINQLQATLSQGTVPSGNTGSLAALLSGIVHQIKALSGKSNWWETPKDSFETLSAGVVAGDVSNANAWWVKLGGAVPLIIQGVTVVMTGGWDTVRLPISANNYFAIASPATPTTNYWSGGANNPVSVQSVKTNSIIVALSGGNQWKASILIIGTV